ncbi:MAG: Na/Pi symporter, partial [Desulfitobacteriaceae bacterium]
AQSSTVIIAIMISLAGQHLLPAAAIVPLVLGAHNGGTITALFSSLTAQKMDAKRTAIANTAYKFVATIMVFPFLAQFSRLVQWTTGDLQRQVANAHLLFAVFMVIVFLPLNSIIARFLVRLLPERIESNPRRQLKFIDESSLEVPTVALSHAFQEIRGVGQFIFDKMIQKMPEALLARNESPVNQVVQAEEDVDWYYHNISRFLSSLSLKGLTEEQIEEKINAQFILKEFEDIADKFMSMATIVRKVHSERLIIPQEEWEQLSQLYNKITDNFGTVLKALEGREVELAAQAIREHPEISRVHRALQFAALAQGPRVDLATKDIKDEEKIIFARIELINLFYGIDEHLVNIAQAVLGIV